MAKAFKGPYWKMDDLGKYWLTFKARCDDANGNYIYCLPQFRAFVETVQTSDQKCGPYTVEKPTPRMMKDDSILASMRRFKRQYKKTFNKTLDLDIPELTDWATLQTMASSYEVE